MSQIVQPSLNFVSAHTTRVHPDIWRIGKCSVRRISFINEIGRHVTKDEFRSRESIWKFSDVRK